MIKGILDPKGENINPLNDKPYSDEYKTLSKLWSNYPAYKNVEKTINDIKENQVILITSGTGSGKTVLIPKFVLHSFDYKKKIMIILPKQIIAKSSAEFAAKTLDVKIGEQVGYKYRGTKEYSKDSKLLYTTDGTLVSMLLSDPTLKEYDSVIIDEAHERRVQTDFLLYLLKQVCTKRDDFKLIIMSATVNEEIFAEYYKDLRYKYINITGRSNFPISRIYSKQRVSKKEYIEKGLERIREILKTTKDGDILFFVPSISEIFNVCKQIKDIDLFCVEVFAGMKKESEELAISKDLYKERYPEKKRKIIVATNVAESSLTIENVKFIVDSGYENLMSFDPETGSKVMKKKLVTQSQIKQRCGRTGRTSMGLCYHLYTVMEFDELDKFPKPEIQTSNIYKECLNLLAFPEVQNFDALEEIMKKFIQPPQKEYMDYAENLLTNLKLVKNRTITSLGKFIATLPADPMQGLAILEGYTLNCYKSVIAIIIMIDILKNNINELFYFTKTDDPKKKEIYDKIKKRLMKSDSDHYNLLKIYKSYKKHQKEGGLSDWIKKNMLKENTLKKIKKYTKKMLSDCKDRFKKEEYKKIESSDISLKNRILLSFIKGFYGHIAEYKDDTYGTKLIKHVKISQDSCLAGREESMILYNDIITIENNSFLQINSVINQELLNTAIN
jgi:HrpA-like RNA helicase